jgi:hypothetical protein
MSWPSVLLLVNLISWTVFVARAIGQRRAGHHSRAALAAGLLHMLFIAPMSIAPLRAILEPETFHIGLAWLQVSGWAAAIPATVIWIWGLTAALVAVSTPQGRALRIIAVGDLIVAANFGTYFTVQVMRDALRAFTAQAGGFAPLSGMAVGIVVMTFFVVPFTLSAFWALRGTVPTPPALGGDREDPPREGRPADDSRPRRPMQMSFATERLSD